jgi:hypothetical protein
MDDGLDSIRQLASSTDAPAVDLLSALGDDAAKWAAAFCTIAKRQGHDLDEGWVIGWFANAIEHSHDVRTGRGWPPQHGWLIGW